jgi:transcriptional regulator with GAF, ATPase, and Fis domain
VFSQARSAAEAANEVGNELSERLEALSRALWGDSQLLSLVGRHPALIATLARAARFARSEAPVLVTGETGTGKELFARALYLLSPRYRAPFLSINCAQYQEGQVIASELFGHRRGSFTGATTDHKGIFESADGGVVFLDEVGELSLAAQAMLLRLLSAGEIVPVGETRSRKVNTRIVVATNRDLREMVSSGRFREDLYYRLRCLHLQIPPVRDRGEDWRLIASYYLENMAAAFGRAKVLSERAVQLLQDYPWPGNVREIRGLIETGYHLSELDSIEPADFADGLEASPANAANTEPPSRADPALFERLLAREGSFWSLVQEPYLNRDLNREEVRQVVSQGLWRTHNSYKKLLELFGVDPGDYLKFMDFLRHHRLKPTDRKLGEDGASGQAADIACI